MAIESVSGKVINNVLPSKSSVKEVADVKQQPAASIGNDTVALTATAEDIKTKAAGADVPIIDQERVAAIKTALQSGSYRVDASRVAEKILNFENKLPDST